MSNQPTGDPGLPAVDYPVMSREEWWRERNGTWLVMDGDVEAAAIAARARGDAVAERAALDELIRRGVGRE